MDGWMDGKGSVLRVFPCVAYETKTAGFSLKVKTSSPDLPWLHSTYRIVRTTIKKSINIKLC